MYLDRDIDKLMERTKNRPLVTGAVTPRDALIFAVVLEILAFVVLWVGANLLSAVLAAAAMEHVRATAARAAADDHSRAPA